MFTNANFRFTHTIDVYAKSTEENDVGQDLASWTRTYYDQRCFYTPPGRVTSIRTIPTIEETDYFGIILPANVDIDYGTRFWNIRDRPGRNVLHPGPLQVAYIYRQPSYTGKIQFLHVRAKSVVE